jgi:hypothetical protein
MMGGAGHEAANREAPRFAVKNTKKKSYLVGHILQRGKERDAVAYCTCVFGLIKMKFRRLISLISVMCSDVLSSGEEG